MTLHYQAILLALFATAALGVGCGSGDARSDDSTNGEAAVAGISIQGLTESRTLNASSTLTLNAASDTATDATTEYTWNVTAPQNAVYNFAPNGSELQFTARTPGEYLISATACNSAATSSIDCSVTESAVTVQTGADSNNNRVGVSSKAATSTASSSSCDGWDCGTKTDGTYCGSCTNGTTCDQSTGVGHCVASACNPSCQQGKQACGTDIPTGCSCGTCADGYTCAPDGTRCNPGPKPGRVVTLVMMLTDRRLAFTDPLFHQRARLIQQSVQWVSPVSNPNVLVVQDDTSGNFTWDVQMVLMALKRAGIQASLIQEPANGLSADQLNKYDVVWFSNPAHPVDDTQSIKALEAVVSRGGGVILQGDDITQGTENSTLTRLRYVSDGEYSCGLYINDDLGASYEIEIGKTDHPVVTGLTGDRFYYGNDIDASTVIDDPKATVLAWATAKTCRVGRQDSSQCPQQPVIVAYDAAK